MTDLMNGFPPSPQGQVTLANWRAAPFNRWAFQHVREIVPSADIPHDPARALPLPTAVMDTGSLRIPDPQGGSITLDAFLQRANTDALVVLRDGRIVIERYANGMGPRTPHILMSVSKSLLGLLTGIVVAQDKIDPDQLVTDVVPELVGTAYEGAKVRHLLDMRTGVAFDEDYLATSGPIVEYRKSTNWNPLGSGELPSDLRSFYQSLRTSDGHHGGRFHYVSPNTDLLGWVVERASDQRFADMMSNCLWKLMGAECSAYVTVDRLGAPRCAGGICATARDLARVGQLLVDGGVCAGTQIIPPHWIDDITLSGSQDAWADGVFAPLFPGRKMHYRNKWYVDVDEAPLLFGLGIHGQSLFVDRRSRIVVAIMSSQALPLDPAMISLTMSAVAEVRSALAVFG
ncbi:MAG: serine hydrolase [Alphaproteobacteria bacterium]|nr:serine hydrolase [Alphaproteobacteria bacterium]